MTTIEEFINEYAGIEASDSEGRLIKVNEEGLKVICKAGDLTNGI